MNAHAKYSTQILQLGLLALAACAVAGCWEEVHYTPPTGADAAPSRARENPAADAAVDDTASNFADDVATRLDSPAPTTPPGEPVSAGGEVAPRYPETTPITEEETPRYPEVTPIPAEEPARYVESTPTPSTPPVEPPPTVAPSEPTAPITPAAPPAAPPVTPRVTPPPNASPAANPASNTRRVAWLLGTKLSLAALANDRGADASEVAKWFDQSQALAKLLGTSVGELPTTTTSGGGATTPGVDYIFNQGQQIGRDIAARYGEDHAALFELAAKSNILLAIYQPNSPPASALAEAIANAGQRAELPAMFFEPLLKSVRLGNSQLAVREAILQLNRNVDLHVSAVQP